MRGFSLVELSIVLVILGLLTGGILAGQSLVRAAELRAITSEQQRYTAAMQTFRDKYMAIPGDMREATRFWNRQVAASHCVSNHGLSAAGTPGACDGNGNGVLSFPANASESGESFQFWRQLALAGLIEGSYDGLAGSGSYAHGRIGITVPASKLSNAGWGIFYNGPVAADSGNVYAGSYGNIFTFGTASSTAYPYGAAIKPEEAWNIDTKMDDGRPAFGNIISWRATGTYTPNCADNAAGASAQYNVTNTTNACALLFINAI